MLYFYNGDHDPVDAKIIVITTDNELEFYDSNLKIIFRYLHMDKSK